MRLPRATVAALVCSALLVPGAAQAREDDRCERRPGTDVVAVSEEVAVVSQLVRRGDVIRYSGCRLGARSLQFLGRSLTHDGTGANAFAVAGRWATWSRFACSAADGCFTLLVRARDLVSGRALRMGTRGLVESAVTEKGQLVVLDGGQSAPWELDHRYRVRVVTAGGTTLLAAGGDIEAGSLAVGGGRAYWTRAGRPESAALPPGR